MKKLFITTVIALLTVGNIMAADVQYDMKVDGINCPVCVAASAKALKKIDGVKAVSADIDKGLIKVCAEETVTLTDEQMKELFTSEGFSFISMEQKGQCEAA